MRCALDICGHVIERALDGRYDVADSREVEHVLRAVEQRVSRHKVSNVPVLEYHSVVLMMREILLPATGQVVDHPDVKPLLDQQIDHMAADEPGATSHDRNRASQPTARRPASWP